IARWARGFPYVNGGLFSGSADVPCFSPIARSYLLHIGHLDWKRINPDIFGSMIQAVADDEERGALGMHYTSVPNILKVLNPLFLDDLRDKLEQAKDNPRKLLNLRNRMARIRVFDPACGSGNFLVIAYKKMRTIESEINKRRGESGRPTTIPLTNFRGIELRDFPAEIARLALIIAEYQCDELYRGQKEALADFLPLDRQNWITCGNALRLDWLDICPPTGTGVTVKTHANNLFDTPLEQPEIDFENEGGETYICGNPPYLGSTWQKPEQKEDLKRLFEGRTKRWKSLDYVAGWLMKAADYGQHATAATAFVATNSICQGQQVPILWPLIFQTGHHIIFAHTSFKWANLASHNAGVTVVIVGIAKHVGPVRKLYGLGEDGKAVVKDVENINQYLVSGPNIIVHKASKSLAKIAEMDLGNMPVDGGNLLLTKSEEMKLNLTQQDQKRFIRRLFGSAEFIKGINRYCLWINDADASYAYSIPTIQVRIDAVRKMRLSSPKAATRAASQHSHRFGERRQRGSEKVIIIPSVSSENRQYLPCGLLPPDSIVSNLAFALYDAPLWTMALIASRLHLVWIATVCGKLKTDFRY
ncbi:MAG: lactate dehydrogenase, partial [Candidatus Synechococcus spongiarum 142]